MKYIRKVDCKWHNSVEERTPITTDVEFMDTEGNVYNGQIVVEMSGEFVYLRHNNGTTEWSSFDKMVKWRFIPNKKYSYYL